MFEKKLNKQFKKFSINKKTKSKIIKVILVMTIAVLLSSCNKENSFFVNKNSKNNLFIQNQNPTESPEWLMRLDAVENSEQIIVVAGIEGTTAYVSMHEKGSDGKWKMILETPGYIGLEGLGDSNINNQMTPIGTFTIDKAFGIADNPGCKMEYTKVTREHYWSGDSRDGMHFNELVNFNDVPGIDISKCERIDDFKYEYKYCLNMGYNSEKDPNKGYGFFLHCTGLQKPYTGGCVAINEALMKVIMQKVKKGCKIAIHRADKLGINLEEMQKFTNEADV